MKIKIDSRDINPGDTFIPVKVKKFDLDTNYFETKDKTNKVENKNNS